MYIIPNEVLFEDDMESGTNGWSSFGVWAPTTTTARSGTHAWTDSPDGHYQNNLNASFISSPIIDLTEVESATLTFWHRYNVSRGDYADVLVGRRTNRGSDIRSLRTFSGTSPGWEKVSIDLTAFVGAPVRLYFGLYSDASGTADGWYIDDIAVFSSNFMTPEPPHAVHAALGNPAPNSPQSGVGLVSGWACDAAEVLIEFALADGRTLRYPAALGTVRTDTEPICGDTDNGFGLLWNWNILGDGEHIVRAYVDGVLLAER